MVTVGQPAPTFALRNHKEEAHTLDALRGHPVLIYFYPKADTPGCTQQACALRDIADQVGDTVIIGISPDKPAALGKFRDKYALNFELLSDPDHSVAEAYGVWKEKKNYGKTYMGIERSAFLVGADGTIRNAWYKISPKDTPTRLLEALAE
ncbi:MAG TPA: thioredoxin-dependent thiol peroxidase [Ilumatobacteraceae bacterium]